MLFDNVRYWIDKSRCIYIDKQGFLNSPNNVVVGNLAIVGKKGKPVLVNGKNWKSKKNTLIDVEIKIPDNFCIIGDLFIRGRYISIGKKVFVLGHLEMENVEAVKFVKEKSLREKEVPILIGDGLTVGKVLHLGPRTYVKYLPKNMTVVGILINGCYGLEYIPDSLIVLEGGLLVKNVRLLSQGNSLENCYKNNITCNRNASYVNDFLSFQHQIDLLVDADPEFVLKQKNNKFNPNVKVWLCRDYNIYLDHDDVLNLPENIADISLYLSVLRNVGTVDSTKAGFEINQSLDRVVIKGCPSFSGDLFIKAKELEILDGINIKGNFKATGLIKPAKLKGDFNIQGIWYFVSETNIEEMPENVNVGAFVFDVTRSNLKIHENIHAKHGGVRFLTFNIEDKQNILGKNNVVSVDDKNEVSKFIVEFTNRQELNSEVVYEEPEFVDFGFEDSANNLYDDNDYVSQVDNPLIERFGF